MEKKQAIGDGLFVIRMGLEPMTHSLEGCCSNPTELPNHPRVCGDKGTNKRAKYQILFEYFRAGVL